ncbi:MAG: hypothetical protein R8G66_07360 [Cytophagales bacterium]|nr:hypothetical protein [Cytophagales bacterium]
MNLDDIKQKNHPYKVPEGYFEELNTRIMEQTSAVPSDKVVSWYRQPVWQMALASVSLVMVIGVVLLSGGSVEEQDFLADVTDEEILIYLADNDLTESEIMENFTFTEEDLLPEGEELLDDIEIDDNMLDELYLDYEIDDLSSQI